MRKQILNILSFALFICLTMTASVQAQNRPYRVSDRTVQNLLSQIEIKTDTFKRELNRALDRSRINNTNQEDMIMNYITEFENSTDALKQRFDARRSVNTDVQDVLNRAAYINQFMTDNRLTRAAERQWTSLQRDLNTLAGYYSVSWNWSSPIPVNTVTNRPYRVNDNQVNALLNQIETKTDTFKRVINNSLDRSRINNTNQEDMVMNYITEFENATDRLKQNFDARRSVDTDVSEVLTRASYIDNFVRNNRLSRNTLNQWSNLRTDLDILAGYYNVSWNWDNVPVINNNNTTGRLPYRVNDNNVRSILTQIEQRTDTFKRNMNTALDRSVLNNTRSEQALFNYITEFENATDKLKQNFDARRSTQADVEEVLSRAYNIDAFMRDYRFSTVAENDWRLIRTDLDTLTNYYSVTWNWNNRQYVPASRFDQMITGTYRLNQSQSDDVRAVVTSATNNYYPAAQRDNIQRNLERRLTSPEMLAIEKRNNEVLVASSLSPQISFNADGTARTETMPNGRSIKVTANTYYDGVALNYEGDRINDFYVNFVPMSNGQLKVIRRVYLENRNDTVTVASVYDKINESAQFSMVNNNQNAVVRTGDFVVPNNTQLVAVLRTPVSTKASQDGDRFRMEVISPSQFNGAIIEGRVARAERSGQVSGRAQVSLEFDSIRLRNGTTYQFAGIVDDVTLASGEKVSVNNEGTVRDNNQTTKTVTRAGIGAALGALIGAIAGGGQGAAIGAAVGAGAGAGTVILQGRDDVEMGEGTQFTITSTAPSNLRSNR